MYPGQPVCYEFYLGSGRGILYKRTRGGRISTFYADERTDGLDEFYDGYLNLNKRMIHGHNRNYNPYPLGGR